MSVLKKVLYISNIEAPYRKVFFNELAKHCDLTVLYEREKSNNRDESWPSSENVQYRRIYLNGKNIGPEFSFSFQILKVLKNKYDAIIVGCYNSPVQVFAALFMKTMNIPFIMNFDGEMFVDNRKIKGKIKKLIIKTADSYLVAGEKAAISLRKIIGNKKVTVYYNSSLTESQLREHALLSRNFIRNKTVLVVGQYYDYKGLDVVIAAAKMNPNIHYKFVGTGKRTDLFVDEQHLDEIQNVESFSFVSDDELKELYATSAMLVLPSRQECWGLVVNEAASYGTPIVSTWGSGAAVEFLSDAYPECLAEPGNAKDLYLKISKMISAENIEEILKYLIEKAKYYSIEQEVIQTIKAF